ncbi:MAG TPA: hypothetical protein PKK06_16600 [Phycisphaerae bacterium]|nr:hypothetical protein [Phycisphaerae bacterium]HNU45941.1 hypothetical protein [Phycisphaerae bacterium]
MADQRETFQPAHPGLFIPALLRVLGAVVLLLAPLTLLVLLAWRASGETPIDALFAGLLMIGLIVGITLGGLLLGVGAALHGMAVRTQALADLENEAPAPTLSPAYSSDLPAGMAPALGHAHNGVLLAIQQLADRLVPVVAELQELQMTPTAERTETIERIRAGRQRRLGEQIVEAINLRQIGRARALLDDARTLFGNTPTLDKLADKIDEAATRNEPLDFARARVLVESAMHAGRWAVAEHHAQVLWRDHPHSARCRKLWDETRRARLYAHIQDSAHQHQWLEALAAAEEFIARFPDGFEADALGRQMATLRSNAEIQTRRQYENRFKELVTGKHYLEALRLAQFVIAQYPDSPQAGALRTQVPILERFLSPGQPAAGSTP